MPKGVYRRRRKHVDVLLPLVEREAKRELHPIQEQINEAEQLLNLAEKTDEVEQLYVSLIGRLLRERDKLSLMIQELEESRKKWVDR